MRMRPVPTTALAAALATVLVSTSASAVSFVACPVYRDTDAGRKSGCWIATDGATGIRYDVTDSPNKPLVGRMILVEGEPAGSADICGGVPLNPVRVAVLSETCAEVMIPAEGFPSKPSVLPAETMQPLGVPRKMPAPPYSPQTWQVGFTFNDDRLMYQSAEVVIEKAMLYATASKARKVRITGYADVRGFTVSGRKLAEPAPLARDRALMVREALVRLGVPPATISTEWRHDPQAISGGAMAAASKRRVTIVVAP